MNFNYTTNPGYVDLVANMYKAMRWYYRADNWAGYSFPDGFVSDFRKYFHFPADDIYPIIYLAVLFTIARYVVEGFVCKPLVNYLRVSSKADRQKFPESCWKTMVYAGTWGYLCYILFFDGRFNYFTESTLIWDDWAIGMPVPLEIKLIYLIECAFYLHSIYATIYMDTWRKDSIIMLLHHVVTMTLIIVSYGTRFHKVGTLVLFVHDITDILLEFTKCNVHLKTRNGKEYALHDHVANVGFAVFTLAWFVFRLYWFPLKILYTTGVVAVDRAYKRGAGLYAFFNLLLWFIFLLDVYWFKFILIFLYKVATGQVSGVEDTRDYEEAKAAQLAAAKLNDQQAPAKSVKSEQTKNKTKKNK